MLFHTLTSSLFFYSQKNFIKYFLYFIFKICLIYVKYL
nr:MAG TPA: hypothetical protein [Caudoviricetes sp.]